MNLRAQPTDATTHARGTPIRLCRQVYAKFVSRDDNSGRVSYVAGRKTSLRVTDLVKGHLRVADPLVATLRDSLLIGRAPGRTKVQVSPPGSPCASGSPPDRDALANPDVLDVGGL